MKILRFEKEICLDADKEKVRIEFICLASEWEFFLRQLPSVDRMTMQALISKFKKRGDTTK